MAQRSQSLYLQLQVAMPLPCMNLCLGQIYAHSNCSKLSTLDSLVLTKVLGL